MKHVLATLVCLASIGLCHAVIETYEFTSPELEARYHSLSQELRCPKCQNQNIADSNAPIAQNTVLLWGAPAMLLILGAIGLAWHFRQRSAQPVTQLSATEQAELDRLLRDSPS